MKLKPLFMDDKLLTQKTLFQWVSKFSKLENQTNLIRKWIINSSLWTEYMNHWTEMTQNNETYITSLRNVSRRIGDDKTFRE